MASKKFPETIYVIREEENNGDSFLAAHEEEPRVDESTVVAVYKLVEVGMVAVTRAYESPKKRSR